MATWTTDKQMGDTGGATTVFESEETRKLDSALRALATAGKSLRLYPASSPIPHQSVEAAASALDEFFREGEMYLSLTVARDNFTWRGLSVGAGSLGTGDLLGSLRDHGVAEMSLTPGCTPEELLGFLGVVAREPDEIRTAGGMSAALADAGVHGVTVTEVQLTVIEQVLPADGEDIESFLRELAQDPEKLAAWFAAASAGDPATFEEGLMELVRVSGPSGFPTMLESLASAFLNQDSDAKDVLLGLSMDAGPTRDLTSGMLSLLSSGDIAGSVLGGAFGRNMLSLSSALTKLPLEQVTAQVRAEVQAMLPSTGHTTKEADFLDHMLEVRGRTEPEAPLEDVDRTYRAVVEAATLPAELIERARDSVAGSGGALTAASVRTMLTLLDQQKDFELYCSSVDAIAHVVPRLVEQGDLELAAHVLNELSTRETRESVPWPDLSARLRDALEVAAGPAAMAALVRAVAADRTRVTLARDIVSHGGSDAVRALVAEAIALKAEGLEVAEELVGRRVVDALAQLASGAQWFQLAPIVSRLARESDTRSQSVLENLMRHPDDQARKEIVTGLATALGPLAVRLLDTALRDPSPEVASLAARALGRSGDSAAARSLGDRLGEIDADNADFLLARELLGALARVPGDEPDAILEKWATRRTLMKRGHFAEVQDIVRQAQRFRAQGGGVR